MKKFFLMSALAVAMFSVSYAQNEAKPATQLPQVRAKAMVSKITNSVGLQGDQVGKVNQLYIDYYTKLDALGANAPKEKVESLNKEIEGQLAGTLTPSQLNLWKSAK